MQTINSFLSFLSNLVIHSSVYLSIYPSIYLFIYYPSTQWIFVDICEKNDVFSFYHQMTYLKNIMFDPNKVFTYFNCKWILE